MLLANVDISSNQSASLAGGLGVSGGSATILNSRIEENIAGNIDEDNSFGEFSQGGGLALESGASVTADRTQFIANSAETGGGISIAAANLVLRNNSRVLSNTSDGVGAGVANFGTIEVLDSFFAFNNSGGDGGGLFQGLRSRGTVTNTRFLDNVAAGDGSGIYLRTSTQQPALAGRVRVTDSIFARNEAGGSGGGIANAGVAAIQGTLFNRNIATVDGGGLATLEDGRSIDVGNDFRSNTPNDIA